MTQAAASHAGMGKETASLGKAMSVLRSLLYNHTREGSQLWPGCMALAWCWVFSSIEKGPCTKGLGRSKKVEDKSVYLKGICFKSQELALQAL